MSKGKIALCFYGYVGVPFSKSINYEKNKKILNKDNRIDKIMLELSHQHIINDIVKANPDYQFDIFIHSWNHKIKNEIIEKFNPKKATIEKLITDHEVFLNEDCTQNLSRLLGTVKVINLVNEYIKELGEDKNNYYQQVILTRFDIAINVDFKLDKYINDNIKIVDGFHKGDWHPEPEIYNDKLIEDLNLKYVGNKVKVDFNKKEVRIIEKMFISNLKNMEKLVNYYYFFRDLIKSGKPINWNPHVYYSNMILDIITNESNISIEKIKELYFDITTKDTRIPEESTFILTKQMYFRNPGPNNTHFGTIKGDIKGRIINIRELLQKYEIPEEIIKVCE